VNEASFQTGAKLGPYDILGTLGAGGMGTVYRARDSKLKREIAIKVLPQELMQDGNALARFQREAEALASLKHPNIGAIYDILQSDHSTFLVLELIEGETLQQKICRGAIPLEQALPFAKQIAEALEAAHEKGITHRDLKPANVKVTPDGLVKVLDFGLAKMSEPQAGAGTALSNQPTIAMSMPGMILGTPAYMAPEQAKGEETNRTSDIWSFGCVLYEMLTGHPVFEGATRSEILADVLKAEPDWQRLPAETPESIRRLLKRCLRKDPKTRLRDIGDARIEIAEALNWPASEAPAVLVAPASRLKERFAWLLLAIVTLIAGGGAVRFLNGPAPTEETRVDIATTPTFQSTMTAISPDGRKLAYVAESEGHSQLWVRKLDSTSAKPLRGTNYAAYPFWSPDSRTLGFFADAKLKKIDTETSQIQILASAVNARGGSWNKNNVILFSPVSALIYRIPDSGGKSEPVTRGDQALPPPHVFPHFLPDGQHFLFYAGNAVYASSLDDRKPMRLVDAEGPAEFASSGHLLFVQKGMVLAQAFDPVRLTLSGTAFPVAEQGPSGPLPIVSVSAAGPIVFRQLQPRAASMPYFAWFDRKGNEIERIDAFGANTHWALSRDSNSFAQERVITFYAPDIWRIDFMRGIRSQITNAPSADTFPVWSHDGQRVAFTSNRLGANFDLYVGLVDNLAGEELLLSSSENKIATDWSADGDYLLYRNLSADSGYDVWALPLDAKGKKNGEPIAVARTDADERDGQFSGDGKWVAYQSNETGSFEIYVQPFPGPGTKYQVSQGGGGSQVRWNGNGKELFYVGPDARLMSVPIRLDSMIEHDTPVPLFRTSLRGAAVQSTDRQQYAISSDGMRILMRADAPEPNALPLTLILNWKSKP